MQQRLNTEQLLSTARAHPRLRVTEALRSQGLLDLPTDHPAIPGTLRGCIQWAKLEQRSLSQSAPAMLFTGAMLFAAAFQGAEIWALPIGCVLMLIGAASMLINAEWLANNKLNSLCDSPYVFCLGETVYEHLPQLNLLETELHNLKEGIDSSRQIQEEILQLIKQLKEQLILLGQSTNDPSIKALYTEESAQKKWQYEAAELLSLASQKHQQAIAIRSELHKHAKLEALRQQAAAITGEHHSPGLSQLTELELSSHELVIRVHNACETLSELQLRWRAQSESNGL